MTWNLGMQNEIDNTLATQDVSEVIAKAVSEIASGAVGCFAAYRLGHTESYDPRQQIDFGERLLVAAIEKLKEDIRNEFANKLLP